MNKNEEIEIAGNDGEEISSKTIEESFGELEGLLSEMESDEASLEEAFLLYEKGSKMLASLHSRLSSLEGRIEQIKTETAWDE